MPSIFDYIPGILGVTILREVRAIREELRNMPTKAEFDAVIESINTFTSETSAVLSSNSTKLDVIIEKLSEPGLSSADEATIKTALDSAVAGLGGVKASVDAEAAKMDAVGQNPDEPVPEG